MQYNKTYRSRTPTSVCFFKILIFNAVEVIPVFVVIQKIPRHEPPPRNEVHRTEALHLYPGMPERGCVPCSPFNTPLTVYKSAISSSDIPVSSVII